MHYSVDWKLTSFSLSLVSFFQLPVLAPSSLVPAASLFVLLFLPCGYVVIIHVFVLILGCLI